MGTQNVYPVILSGGAGTRLWPMSRAHYPKQLLPLVSDRTMLQETVLRMSSAGCLKRPLVVANSEHRFIVAEQLMAIDVEPEAIILEPFGRNTAPAASSAIKQYPWTATTVAEITPNICGVFDSRTPRPARRLYLSPTTSSFQPAPYVHFTKAVGRWSSSSSGSNSISGSNSSTERRRMR